MIFPGRSGKGVSYHPFRILLPVGILLLIIVGIGIVGYMIIEGWPFLDATYMVVITLLTIGFQEVHALSAMGRIFTMLLVIAGVGSSVYAAGRAVEIIIEGEMSGYYKRKRMEKRISDMTNHYIICGYGRVGHQVAEALESARAPYVVIDSKPESSEELDVRGIPILIGDATSDDTLMEAGIETAKALIACSDSDVANVFVTLSARVLNPQLFIVARAGIRDTEKKLRMAGANRVLSPYFIAGRRMAALATRPITSDVLDLISHGGDLEFSLYEVAVPQNSPLVQKTLAEADIRGVSGAMVLAIRRADGSFDLQPAASSKIEKDDVLVVIGTEGQLGLLQKMMG